MKTKWWLLMAAAGWLTMVGSTALAQAPRWVEANSWKGLGTRQTEIFFVNAEQWVIKHKHNGNGLFQISLYDEKGKLLDVPVNLSSSIPGIAYLKGRGARYLRISAEADWEVTIDQFVTKVEEWNLVQIARSYPRPEKKQAVWTGESGSETFSFTISKGNWKIVATAESGGNLSVQVKDSGGLLECDLRNNREAGSCDSFGHKIGTFSLTVKAQDTAWKVELLSE